MRFLHTSDWHIGRTFHGHSTLEAVSVVLSAIPEIVREHSVDAVLVAGDIFDAATPSAAAYDVLTRALRGIRDAGADVVVTSGNHDSATRLGFQSEWARYAGVHVLTDPSRIAQPVELVDAHGPVLVYGVPFLEPTLVRHLGPHTEDGAPTLRNHEDVLVWAFDAIRDDLGNRAKAGSGAPVRSVALAHCFAANVRAQSEASDIERDITAGGLDLVPLSAFAGIDYVALGHIHGRAELAPHIRYSGAPLHYSFKEHAKPRGGWLVEVGPEGFEQAEWVDFPVPRPLSVLTGTLAELTSYAEFTAAEGHWVHARLTDPLRPLDAMRHLQARFPYCALLEHTPERTDATDRSTSYSARVAAAKTDAELLDDFLGFVRGGVRASESEQELLRRALAQIDAAEPGGAGASAADLSPAGEDRAAVGAVDEAATDADESLALAGQTPAEGR